MPTPDPNVTLTSLTVDGNAVAPGSAVSGQGVHTVVATGSDGGVSTTAFVIDTVGPTVEITSGTGTGCRHPVARDLHVHRFRAGDVRVPSRHPLFAPCSSPVNYGVLTPGNHTFQVLGTDIATNRRSRDDSLVDGQCDSADDDRLRQGRRHLLDRVRWDEPQAAHLRQRGRSAAGAQPGGNDALSSRVTWRRAAAFRMDVRRAARCSATVGTGNAANPAFSKAGDKLAFDSAGSGSNREILVAPFPANRDRRPRAHEHLSRERATTSHRRGRPTA